MQLLSTTTRQLRTNHTVGIKIIIYTHNKVFYFLIKYLFIIRHESINFYMKTETEAVNININAFDITLSIIKSSNLKFD